jgi:predicted nucleic acid-binding protein
MSECCIDASIAIKWFIKGEAFRRQALNAVKASLSYVKYLPDYP